MDRLEELSRGGLNVYHAAHELSNVVGHRYLCIDDRQLRTGEDVGIQKALGDEVGVGRRE